MDTSRHDASPGVPHVLPLRLTRKRPGLLHPLVLGVFLGAVAVGAWRGWQLLRGEKVAWALLAVCVLCGLFSVLLLWSCIYQWRLARIPLTLVEISGQPFLAGQAARLALIQPGPAALEFLRADLVCLERLTTWHRRAPDSSVNRELYHNVNEKRLHTQTVIDEKDVRASRGDIWQKMREFILPTDAQASYDSTDDEHEKESDDDDDTPLEKQIDREILWQIELTGKSGLFARFLQTFEVEVKRS